MLIATKLLYIFIIYYRNIGFTPLISSLLQITALEIGYNSRLNALDLR